MIPKLLQLATYQTVRNSKFSQQDLEVLPPNLKDRLRFLLLQTDPKNLERLPALLHEKVAELDLSDSDSLESILCLNQTPYLKKLNLKKSLHLSQIRRDELVTVFQNLVHLEALYLHYNESIVDDQIIQVTFKHKMLPLQILTFYHSNR